MFEAALPAIRPTAGASLVAKRGHETGVASAQVTAFGLRKSCLDRQRNERAIDRVKPHLGLVLPVWAGLWQIS
jgi:hypothetical protein